LFDSSADRGTFIPGAIDLGDKLSGGHASQGRRIYSHVLHEPENLRGVRQRGERYSANRREDQKVKPHADNEFKMTD
jgi:hypothetical protein